MALLVLGPLIWGAVLAQNDLHDLRSDRDNPRKATAPLVTGAVSATRLRVWYRGSRPPPSPPPLYVGPLFVLGVAGVLLLGWAYSVPPLRLKTRPGLGRRGQRAGRRGGVAGRGLVDHPPAVGVPVAVRR